MEKRVLIAEDELIASQLLQEVLSSAGITAVLAKNGKEALAEYKRARFPVVVTDIEMPVMGGKELIQQLMGMDQPPVIIVQTVHTEFSQVIEIMKSGVYDYIAKPIDPDEFQVKVERALETAELRRIQQVVEHEKVIRIERELEWYRWNENVISREMKRLDKSLFHSLHTAFNQGAGFGALLTLLKILADDAKKEGDYYVVDARLMELINDNVGVADKIIETFSNIDRLITQELETAPIDYDRFYDLVQSVTASMQKYGDLKSQRIVVSDKKAVHAGKQIYLNNEYFTRALEELMVNACKFSAHGSAIYVLVEVTELEMLVSIVSEPVKDEQGMLGIPLGYENIVIEPFFRMSKAVFEGYNTMDYGLGLTLVDKILKIHNGKLRIYNIMDYTELTHEPATKVMVTMRFPRA